MAVEIRRQLREKIQAKLQADVTLVESAHIYKARILRLSESSTSAIAVYTFDETGEKVESEDGLTRVQEVIVAVWARGPDAVRAIKTDEESVDDKLDAILGEIEDSLFAKYQTLDKLVYRLNYTGTKISVPDLDTELITLIGMVHFDAIFRQDLT